MTAHDITQHNEIAIRSLSVEDAPALERLAQLDSTPVPDGQLLGVTLDGRLVAAASVETGHSIADPFVPSAELRMLLAERVSQLRGRGRGLHRMPGLRHLARRHPARTRGALGGSPPGAGGRLLKLS